MKMEHEVFSLTNGTLILQFQYDKKTLELFVFHKARYLLAIQYPLVSS